MNEAGQINQQIANVPSSTHHSLANLRCRYQATIMTQQEAIRSKTERDIHPAKAASTAGKPGNAVEK